MLGFFLDVFTITLLAAPIPIVNKLLFRFSTNDLCFKQAGLDNVKSADKQTIHWTRELFGAKFYIVRT